MESSAIEVQGPASDRTPTLPVKRETLPLRIRVQLRERERLCVNTGEGVCVRNCVVVSVCERDR